MSDNASKKYFVYSRTQHREQDRIAESINRSYICGKVYYKGVYKLYTEILDSPYSRYSDSNIIMSTEDYTTANYTEAVFESR